MSRPWPALRRPAFWCGLLVVLGLGLRLTHYLRNPSVWHDEGMIIYNILHKDFAALLGPLTFHQSAPPLFLWIQRAVVLSLGDNTYGLRLVPFLAGCAGLLLFVPLARRVLRPAAVPWAVLLFACSDKILWHGCESKPYTLDMLNALTLVLLFVGTRSWSLGRRLLLFTAVAPVSIFLSFPGCFLCGGLLAALLPEVLRERRPRTLLSYGLLALAVFGSFGLMWAGPMRAQHYIATARYWQAIHHYPDWSRPWLVPWWSLTQTLEVCRYCCHPTGQVLAVLAGAGAVRLWRRGERTLVVLLALPLFLALLAATIKAYPYGGSRLEVYAAPAFFLCVAETVPGLLAGLRERGRWAAVAAAVVLAWPLGLAGYRAVVPWHRPDCAGAAEYVLRSRQDADAVLILGNASEYDYYFRHSGPFLRTLEDFPEDAAVRVWVILSALRPQERERSLRTLVASGRRPLDQREFTSAEVVLLGTP